MSVVDKYEKEIKQLDTNDAETTIKQVALPTKVTEQELEEKSLTKLENVEEIKVKRAYCPECGEELISKLPPMFNPFTQERQCIHKCNKCEKVYNLDYSYPRLLFLDKNGNEIFAHCE